MKNVSLIEKNFIKNYFLCFNRQLTRLETKMNSDISMILQILQSNNANRGYHGDGAATPMSDHPPPNYSHINSPSDSEEKFSQNISLHREDRVVSQVYIHVERYQRSLSQNKMVSKDCFW